MPNTKKKPARAADKKKADAEQEVAANAPKSRSRRAAASPSRRKAESNAAVKAPARAVRREEPAKEEVHVHHTKEPSVWKARLTNWQTNTLATVRRPRFWAWVAGVVVAIFLVLVVWWQWQRSYIAVVGGQFIPVSYMDDQLRANYGNNGVDSVIQQQLILQEGQRQHINITDKQISDQLSKIKTSSGGEASYQQQLKQLGISEDLLKQQVRVQLIREQLLKDKIQVSQKEIDDYYNQNKSTIDPDGKTGEKALTAQIQETLKQQKLDSATPDYVDSLRQRTSVETDLSHLNLSFGDFLSQTIAPIPGNIWNFIIGKK